MKRPFIFCLLFLTKGFSQSALRTVADSTNNRPISYATLKVLHKPIGTMANVNGEFELAFERSDTISITCIGYREKILMGRDIGLRIYLSPAPKSLDTVVVAGTRPLRTIILGNGKDFVNKKMKCGDDCLPWGPAGVKEEFAEKILIDSTKAYRLKKLYMPTRKKDQYGPLLLRIYAEDEITKKPGEELLFKYIEVNKKMIYKSKVVIDISSEDLYIGHSSSFFVSFGWPLGHGGRGVDFTSINLFLLNKDNTLQRNLLTETYYWYQSGYGKSKDKVNTAYAVEMEERVYK